MTSKVAKHMWTASFSVQSQNQGSLWKDASSTPTPSSQFPKMETLFLKSTDVDVQRQLDTYWHLLGSFIFVIELSSWISCEPYFLLNKRTKFCFQIIVYSIVETLPVFLLVDCKLLCLLGISYVCNILHRALGALHKKTKHK